jgi:hypothetical protein
MWLLLLIVYVIGFIILGLLLFAAFMGLVWAYKLAKEFLKTEPKDWQ